MLTVVSENFQIKLATHNLTTPDPGNAGVGRGNNKLSVLRIQPWWADGLTFFI